MNSNRNNKSWGIILLTAALLLGGFLRLYKLGTIPVSLYWDETAIGYDAYSLTQWGKDMHGNSVFQSIYPSYGDYKLPMYIWIDSIIQQVVDPSPSAVRLPSALAGIGIIFLIYLLALELWHRHILAGMASLIQALLPVDILFSRTGFEGHLAVFFVCLTLYLWLVSRKKMWVLGIASITAAMAVYSYFSARVVIPLLATIVFITLWKQVDWRWRSIFLGSLLLWAALLLPIYNSPHYAASNQFRLSTRNLSDTGSFAVESNVLREQSGNGFISRIVYHRYVLQTRAIVDHIFTHFDPRFLFVSGDVNLRHGTTKTGLILLGLLPLFIVGWIQMIKKGPWVALLLIGMWVISVVPAAIPMEVPHALRSLNASIVFPLVLAYGGYTCLDKKKWRITLLGLIGFSIIEFGFFVHDYFVHYPTRSASVWQSGYTELASFLKQNQTEYDRCTIDYSDGRLYLYFLLFMKTNPWDIVYSDTSFIPHFVGIYHFEPVTSLPGKRACAVVSTEGWMRLKQPASSVIRDAADVPIFYVIEGDKL